MCVMHYVQKSIIICALFYALSYLVYVRYICYTITKLRNQAQNEGKKKQMKTYKIYVNGMYVGTEDFTRSEVNAIESDQDIKLIEK